MRRFNPYRTQAGFVLLPVVLLLSLLAATAYLATRDTGLNSAMAGGSTDQDKARLAAEAGLHRSIVKMHSTGCSGTYPIIILSPVKDSAFDGASYYAYATTLSGSPTGVVSTGTYGSASVTLTRSGLPMHQATSYTTTLQPAATEGIDTYLKDTGSSNYGTNAEMKAAAGTTYPLLRFDLSAIPTGSHVTSATLSAYATGGNPGDTLALHRVTSDWTEAATWSTTDGSTTAWTTAGGDVVAEAVASATLTGTNTWMNWDLTELADRWLKGSLPNQGVQLRAGTGVSSLTLASSDSGTATQRPKLAVTFQPPCGWLPPDTTLTLAPLADADIDLSLPIFNYGGQPDLWAGRGLLLDDRVLLKFDSSGIAAGKTVTKATLRLYMGAVNGATKTTKSQTLKVHALTKDWKEMEATWLVRQLLGSWLLSGGDYRSTASASTTLATATLPGTWVEFDITTLMQEWVDGVTPNNGVLMQLATNPSDSLIFNSREAASNPPQLVVKYH